MFVGNLDSMMVIITYYTLLTFGQFNKVKNINLIVCFETKYWSEFDIL